MKRSQRTHIANLSKLDAQGINRKQRRAHAATMSKRARYLVRIANGT